MAAGPEGDDTLGLALVSSAGGSDTLQLRCFGEPREDAALSEPSDSAVDLARKDWPNISAVEAAT